MESRAGSSDQHEPATLLYWWHHPLAKEIKTSTEGQQEAGGGGYAVTEEAMAELESFTPTRNVPKRVYGHLLLGLDPSRKVSPPQAGVT